jgi:hypothetical protein
MISSSSLEGGSDFAWLTSIAHQQLEFSGSLAQASDGAGDMLGP